HPTLPSCEEGVDVDQNGDERLRPESTSDPETRKMFEAVYDQLRNVAQNFMRNEHALSLQPTSLVHEAYLRMNHEDVGSDESRFLGFAAVAMRRILIERARKLGRLKRGGGRRRVPLSQVVVAGRRTSVDLIDLQAALDELETINPAYCDMVVLRFLLGCTAKEAAQALGVSEIKVKKDWRFARSWLKTRLDSRE
ncbi:MAG: ECF-type sigma factor, partial [Planctomycetota bacterium]